MKAFPILRTIGFCVIGMCYAAMGAASDNLSLGRQILLNKGLQIQAQVYSGDASTFDIARWQISNFTTLNFGWTQNPTLLSQMPTGTAWGRWSTSNTILPEERVYVDNLVGLQYGDEPNDLTDPNRLSDMATKYAKWHSRYPNVLAYSNFSLGTGPYTPAELANYMSVTQPDMIMFDEYPGWRQPEKFIVSGIGREYWYSTMQEYRLAGLAGNDGTGAKPIPYGQYLNMIRSSYTPPLPSESYIRLQQNASWAFGYTFVSAYTYNDLNFTGLYPVLFDTPGESSPTSAFGYTAEVNRQSRNLGPALVRLVSSDIRIILGRSNGTSDSLPTGMVGWAQGAGGDSYITGITPLGKDLAHPSTTDYSDVLIGYFMPMLTDNSAYPFAKGTHFMIVNGASQDTAAASAEWYHLTFDFGVSGFNALERLSRDNGQCELVPLMHIPGGTNSQYFLDLNLPGGTGDLFRFHSMPIPEPGTWSLLCACGVAVLLWRRIGRRCCTQPELPIKGRPMRHIQLPWQFCLAVLESIIVIFAAGPDTIHAAEPPPPGCFSLWQLPSQTGSQMNSYVLESPNGHVVVMDGGWTGDDPYLTSFLQGLGGHVDAWFISHQHVDHIGALTSILQDQSGVQLDNIYGSFLSEACLAQHDDGSNYAAAQALGAALAARGKSVIQPALGGQISVDGLSFQTLTLADPNMTSTNFNDQSMVVRLSTPGTSVLFLGDLGSYGGQQLLASSLAGQLPSEYVQMAHHGQNGVGQAVYAAIHPEYALWPTPDWLWTWPTTIEVRGWMEDLGIKENYVMKDGLVQLDLRTVPEPGTLTMLTLGLMAGLLLCIWRRMRWTPPSRPLSTGTASYE